MDSEQSPPNLPPTLLRLPGDLLLAVLQRLEPGDLVCSVSRVCRALRDAAGDNDLWRAVLETRYAPLLREVFGGAAPPPTGACSWRAHYFGFRNSWMGHALESAGRVVMTVGGAVYDVTAFLDAHPGGAELLSAAAGTDASAVFEAVGHSPNARTILARFLLVATMPCDAGLRPRRAPRAAGWSGAAGLVAGALRGGEERSRLRLMIHAVWGDLTEGRPDCRRLSPAVWRLATAQRVSCTTRPG